MSTRELFDHYLSDALSFGTVADSSVGLLKNSLTAEVEADGAEDGDHEVWGEAPLLWRPVDPDLEGECEVMFARMGDEKIVFATKDRRWQISVEKGEVILRAMGNAAPAYLHLKPDGSAILRATTINLGADATDFVALSTLVSAQLASIATALTTHVHAGVTPGGGSSLGAASVYTPGSVAATKTRAK